jgi:hypothetical protein
MVSLMVSLRQLVLKPMLKPMLVTPLLNQENLSKRETSKPMLTWLAQALVYKTNAQISKQTNYSSAKR